MGGTLWFWVIILFTALYQLVAKIRSRIHPHSLPRLGLVGIMRADNHATGVLSGRTAAEDQSYTLNQPGLSKTRSNSWSHLLLDVRQSTPTLVRQDWLKNWAEPTLWFQGITLIIVIIY